MQYRKKCHDSLTEIFVENKFVSGRCEKLSSLIDEFTNSPQTSLIIDFERTTALDTRGLGSLVLALQKVNDAGKSLLLRNPKDSVKDVLKVLKFDTLFTIEFAH